MLCLSKEVGEGSEEELAQGILEDDPKRKAKGVKRDHGESKTA